MDLPFSPPLEPMLAKLTPDLPASGSWIYEPKWDGFRALAFWDGGELYLQSRDLKPLNRYFPEVVEGLAVALPGPVVLDGEVVIATPDGLDFDALLMRIHPAESRVRKLARETPASFVAFDLLAQGSEDLRGAAQRERRLRLDACGAAGSGVALSPWTEDPDLARDWFHRFEGAGLDGVIARPPDLSYRPGERVLLKVKHRRTADCVVGGFRWAKDKAGQQVGSLLLGLHREGVLHYVGHTSSFKAAERQDLARLLEPLRGGPSFGEGRTPGGPSRWRQGPETDWEPVRPELVCEVAYDHLQGDRFRHAATFLRWRPDKPPGECGFEQLEVPVPGELQAVFEAGSRAVPDGGSLR